MAENNRLKNIVIDVVRMIFPARCCACRQPLFRNEKVLCMSCTMKMPKTNFHKQKGNLVEKSFWGRVRIERATSYFYFVKGSDFQHLLHNLKYHGHYEVGVYMGECMGHELANEPDFTHFDAIIPVPLHPGKLRKRGYNQSEMIARGLSKALGVPVDTKTLRRKVFTETQTKKTRIERWENVRYVFESDQSALLNGKHILLVDDVLTTGATIEGCANALRLHNPAVKISVATLAFAHN